MSNKNNYKRSKNRRKEQGLEYAHKINEKMTKYNAICNICLWSYTYKLKAI